MFCIPDEVKLKTAMKLKQCVLLENVNILQLSRDGLDINFCVCVCMYVVGCNRPAVSVVHHPCCSLTLCNRISGDLRSRKQLNWLAERQNVEANY